MARITNLKTDCAAMVVVLSDFSKQRLSVQQNFNLLGGKLNDLKNDSKASIIERLELFRKIKGVATNAHPDVMRHLIKESIDIEMKKQDPIRYSATVTGQIFANGIWVIYEWYACQLVVECSFDDNLDGCIKKCLVHVL